MCLSLVCTLAITSCPLQTELINCYVLIFSNLIDFDLGHREIFFSALLMKLIMFVDVNDS